jgi:hypothetical protein
MNPFIIGASLLGFGLITAGATWLSRPAGLLVAGVMLLLAAHGALRQPKN